MIGTLAGGKSLPPAIPLAIGVSWTIIVAAQVTGAAAIMHHDGLIDAGLPLSMALILFALSWQTMVVAMMVPTSLPMIRLFRMTSSSSAGAGPSAWCIPVGLRAGVDGLWFRCPRRRRVAAPFRGLIFVVVGTTLAASLIGTGSGGGFPVHWSQGSMLE